MTNSDVWEEIYQLGRVQHYPWDKVVSFVFRNAPKGKSREDVHILEVGFGTGSNLWFAAREGFAVTGIEGSPTAVEFAKKRFADEGLSGDLLVGDFTELPFDDNSFDLVIDRAALTCVGRDAHMKAISQINRVLKPGGLFYYNGYTDGHSSYRASKPGPDGIRTAISGGAVVEAGALYLASRSDIDAFFATGWKLHSVERLEQTDMLAVAGEIHSEWMVVAEKA